MLTACRQKNLCPTRCNPESLLPDNRVAFEYDGSLTTPPYSENVLWLVLEESISMSGPVTNVNSQLGCLHGVVGDNHRGLQPLNDREVLLVRP